MLWIFALTNVDVEVLRIPCVLGRTAPISLVRAREAHAESRLRRIPLAPNPACADRSIARRRPGCVQIATETVSVAREHNARRVATTLVSALRIP
jgi:hypothetical protein